MKRFCYFICCISFFFSCNNNSKTKDVKTNLTFIGTKVEKEKLDTNLVEGVLNLIHTGEHLKYPDILLSDSFISVCFEINSEDSQIYFSDSIVCIRYNIIGNNNAPITKYYKGILKIEEYNVAIFDIGEFGEKYYNKDSLIQIPLNSFKHYPMDIILTNTYYIKNGKIKFWNP